MTYKQLKQQEAVNELKKLIKPSSTIQIVGKSVSASGMTRKLKLYVDNRDITGLAAQAMGWAEDKNWQLVVHGCGMDMHVHTVDTLTYAIFGRKKYKAFKGNGGSCLNWISL